MKRSGSCRGVQRRSYGMEMADVETGYIKLNKAKNGLRHVRGREPVFVPCLTTTLKQLCAVKDVVC